MKKNWFLALSFAAGIVLLAGCGSAPKAQKEAPPPQMQDEYVSEKAEGILVDSKTKALGVPMSDWVANYLLKGRRSVERMSDYTEVTVFIDEEIGTNLQGL